MALTGGFVGVAGPCTSARRGRNFRFLWSRLGEWGDVGGELVVVQGVGVKMAGLRQAVAQMAETCYNNISTCTYRRLFVVRWRILEHERQQIGRKSEKIRP